MDTQWYISSSFELIDEYKNEVMAALQDLVMETRKEPGCVSYILTQDRENPRKCMFLEVWEDEAAFRAHTTSAHLKRFKEIVEGKRTPVALLKLQQIL